MSVVLVEIDGYVQDTSTTSLTIGTGSQSLTTDNAQPFKVGMTVIIDDGAGNTMTGDITFFRGDEMTVNVTSTTGSGTIASWVVGGIRTLYFGSRGYQHKDADADPGRFYDGKIKSQITFEHYLFSKGSTSGNSTTGSGDIIIGDPGGVYDFATNMGFNGQNVTILTVESESSAYSTAVTKFSGTVKSMDFSWREKIFTINDKLAELDKPAQKAVFDGSNSGPTGIEGTPDDLEGKEKPFIYGACEYIPAPLLNSSKLIYGINFDSDGNTLAVTTLDNVRDSGLALALDTGVGTGGDTTDLAALQAATITAGQYATCLAEGLFRLGSSPAGIITCDAEEGATAGDRTAAQIAKRILEDRGGYTASDYVSASITALDTANSAVCGIYVSGNKTIHATINEVLDGIGANIFENAAGQFDFAMVVDPDGETSIITLQENDIIAAPGGGIEKIPARDGGSGTPAKQIKLKYRKFFYTFRDNDFAGAVTDADRAILTKEFRSASTAVDTIIETKHPNAPILEFNTLLTSSSDADTEMNRRNTLFSTNRTFFEVMTSPDTLLEVGQTLTLELGRYGYSAGKKFMVIGRILLFGRNRVIYIIWG